VAINNRNEPMGSGMYLVRLETPNGILTQNIVFMK